MKSYLSETVQTTEGAQVINIEIEGRGGERYQPFDYGPTRGDPTELGTEAFAKGMALIRTCAEQIAETVAKVSEQSKPTGVEVELGIKLEGQVGALVVASGVEAHLHVKLSWNK